MDPKVQERLDAANEALHGIGFPYRLGLFDPRSLALLTKNARFMRNDTFAQLVANVKRDRSLQSFPFVYAGPDVKKPVVMSGNHRVQAAIEAKLEYIVCIVVDTPMPEQERVAVQIAHNSISGQDDLQTLKELYDGITDVVMKAYSGIDEELRKQLANIKYEAISEPRLQFKTAIFLFMPTEQAEINALAEQVSGYLAKSDNFLFRLGDYEQFFLAVAATKQKLGIKNSAVALLELMRAGLAKIEADCAMQEPDGPPV